MNKKAIVGGLVIGSLLYYAIPTINLEQINLLSPIDDRIEYIRLDNGMPCVVMGLTSGITCDWNFKERKAKATADFNLSLSDRCDDEEIKGWCTSTTPPMTRDDYMELE